MKRTEHICLMAEYNEWMNTKLYEAAMTLSDEELVANRNAFFGSILGTLNHLLVGDTLWLKRFSTHPANYSALELVKELPMPISLDQVIFSDIRSLTRQRKELDQVIKDWTRLISEEDLDYVMAYSNMKGIAAQKNYFSLVMHLFNHQTHHRGQATTLLTQANVDVGATDLIAIIPNESAI